MLLGPGEHGGPLLRADCTLDLRRQTRCYAFYASIPAQDDDVHLWEGQLGHIPELIADNGGPFEFSPTDMSSAERDWFVYTDEDLLATKVSGTEALIDDLRSDPGWSASTGSARAHSAVGWEKPTYGVTELRVKPSRWTGFTVMGTPA